MTKTLNRVQIALGFATLIASSLSFFSGNLIAGAGLFVAANVMLKLAD